MNDHAHRALADAHTGEAPGTHRRFGGARRRTDAAPPRRGAATGNHRRPSYGPAERDGAMTWPTVTELPRTLEPVTRDPFNDACVSFPRDAGASSTTHTKRPVAQQSRPPGRGVRSKVAE